MPAEQSYVRIVLESDIKAVSIALLRKCAVSEPESDFGIAASEVLL